MSDRAAEHRPIGNIAIATADHGWDPLLVETEIGAWTFDFDSVRLFHQTMEGLHARPKLPIIQRADFEIEIFKRLGAHSCKLCHGRCGPAQDYPFGLFDSLILYRPHFPGD